MTAILKITDGVSQVDLLDLREGVSMNGWRQAVAGYKGGGTWQQSSLSDGRRLVDKRFMNVTETFPIAIGRAENTQDITIAVLHRLFDLMEAASSYWITKWQTGMVWLEARSECETNTRYAIVHTANIPQIAELYAPGVFNNDAALDAMSLVIERGHWTEAAPGHGIPVELSAMETYDGRNLGNVDSAGVREPTVETNQVFVGNKHNVANITHIYHYNATVPAWSGNLMTAALPYALTPALAGGQVGLTYFGIDSTLANDGPFTSLIFDIGTASANLVIDRGWEYYNLIGAGWGAMNLINDDTYDAPDYLSHAGIQSVHFGPAISFGINDWGPGNLLAILGGAAPNVTGWWARLSYQDNGAAITVPTQQNRDIYTVTWPYTELQADQAAGNINALSKLRIFAETGDSDSSGLLPSFQAQTGRLFVSLRALDRGSNFSPYINASDTQNPTGITTSVFAASAYINTSFVPSGRAVEYTSAGAGLVKSWNVAWSASLIDEYTGKYRLFARVRTDDSVPSDSSIQAKLSLRTEYGVAGVAYNIYWTSDEASLNIDLSNAAQQDKDLFEMLDLGEIELPAPVKTLLSEETGNNIRLDLYANAATGQTVLFCDVILVPVDEWVIELLEHRNASPGGRHPLQLWKDEQWYSPNRRYFSLDAGVSVPKEFVRANLHETNGSFVANWLSVKNNRPFIAPSGAQRLWFLAASRYGSYYLSGQDTTFTVALDRNAQYLGPRGDQ